MKEKAERVPVYCPKCQTEWQPNATCCSGCGAKLAQRELPPTPQRSGAKEGREIEYIEETTIIGRVTVISYRPILTAEERKKREQQVINTLSAIARSDKRFLICDIQKE